MIHHFSALGLRWAKLAVCLVLCWLILSPNRVAAQQAGERPRPIKGPLHNQDCNSFFYMNRLSEANAGELIDRYVDVMAKAGVTVYLCNTNARRTNYPSRVLETFWDGYDPNGPDNQPLLASLPKEQAAGYRRMLDSMLAMHRAAIDYPARVVARCRHDGISPWISLRMNDCHNGNEPGHPLHGSFWKKNPQFRRKNGEGNFAYCLDYAHREVRDLYKALVVETLDRYDIDGLELDFLREPYVFSGGEEAAGRPILTAWLRDIRKLVSDAAAKRRHPIRLGVRVPSRPEVAKGLGLDAIAWAKEGLIDLLVVGPRWGSVEFDMPIGEWRKLLGTADVTLAGGLEVLYRPYRAAPTRYVSPELAVGAAAAVLSRGADAVYLFNYYQDGSPGWPLPVYQSTLRAMASLDSLLKLPRSVGITYRDVRAPGEDYRPPLPATGKRVAFSIDAGPVPEGPWICQWTIEFSFPKGTGAPLPAYLLLDGKLHQAYRIEKAGDDHRVASFRMSARLLTEAKTSLHTIRFEGPVWGELTVWRVEAALRDSRGPDAPLRSANPVN
jgi:hypothetical protein